MTDKKFIEYNKDTGLVLKSKPQIMTDLISLCKSSYGQDYSVDAGTEMYAFLDNLAYALAELNGAVKAVYDDFGFTTATGVPLDVLCSLAGISRNDGETDTQLRSRYYKFLYSKSVSTVKSLETKLLDSTATNPSDGVVYSNFVKDVLILNNDTSDPKKIHGVDVTANSIAVICKCPDIELTYSDDNKFLYDAIDSVVREYKSLGCGVMSTTKSYKAPGSDSSTNKSYAFLIAQGIKLTVNIKIKFVTGGTFELDANEQSAAIYSINQKIREYIGSIKLGQDILYTGITSAIYEAQKELNYTESIIENLEISITKYTSEGTSAGTTTLFPTASKPYYADYPITAEQYIKDDYEVVVTQITQ